MKNTTVAILIKMHGLKWFLLQNKDLIVYKYSSKRFNNVRGVINCISYRTKVQTTHDDIRTTNIFKCLKTIKHFVIKTGNSFIIFTVIEKI